MKQVNR